MTKNNPDSQCFVFTTAPHLESRAYASILDLGYKAWLPLEKRLHRRLKAKPVIRDHPLFPRYGFVWFDPEGSYGDILQCDGVQDLLPTCANPIPIRPVIIEALQLAEIMGLFDRTKPPKTGSTVEVLDGVYAGRIGRIIKARSADRAKVALNILFGSERIVDMPLISLREVIHT